MRRSSRRRAARVHLRQSRVQHELGRGAGVGGRLRRPRPRVQPRVVLGLSHARRPRPAAGASTERRWNRCSCGSAFPGAAQHGGPVGRAALRRSAQREGVAGRCRRKGAPSCVTANGPARYPDGSPLQPGGARATNSPTSPLAHWPRDVRVSRRASRRRCSASVCSRPCRSDVLERADPDDADGDGISGRPNSVWDSTPGSTVLGRFGWKANQPTLAPAECGGGARRHRPDVQRCFPARERGRRPEGGGAALLRARGRAIRAAATHILDRLTFYMQVLAVPAARNVDDPVVRAGARLFEQAELRGLSPADAQAPARSRRCPLLSWQTHPSVHGSAAARHGRGPGRRTRPISRPTGREWRTPPLWGIGLTATVNRHTRFLHDGRARSLEEAILWHGGEAASSRDLASCTSTADARGTARISRESVSSRARSRSCRSLSTRTPTRKHTLRLPMCDTCRIQQA